MLFVHVYDCGISWSFILQMIEYCDFCKKEEFIKKLPILTVCAHYFTYRPGPEGIQDRQAPGVLRLSVVHSFQRSSLKLLGDQSQI